MDVFSVYKILIHRLRPCRQKKSFWQTATWVCGKSSSRRISISDARNAVTKATEYIPFGFSFLSLLGKFERHYLLVIRMFRC